MKGIKTEVRYSLERKFNTTPTSALQIYIDVGLLVSKAVSEEHSQPSSELNWSDLLCRPVA
jgi:hypothetical protein